MSSTSTGSVLQRMKRDTARLHQAVERAVPAMRVASRAEYGELLLAFHSVVAPLERRLAGRAELRDVVPELEARWRAPSLERDLALLGLAPPPPAPPAVLPELATTPEALGSLYVLEGSTLGGQVISRRLQQALGIAPAHGGAFFGARGRSLGPMWIGFTGALAGYVESRDGTGAAGSVEQELVRGAIGTYRAFLWAFPPGNDPGEPDAG